MYIKLSTPKSLIEGSLYTPVDGSDIELTEMDIEDILSVCNQPVDSEECDAIEYSSDFSGDEGEYSEDDVEDYEEEDDYDKQDILDQGKRDKIIHKLNHDIELIERIEDDPFVNIPNYVHKFEYYNEYKYVPNYTYNYIYDYLLQDITPEKVQTFSINDVYKLIYLLVNHDTIFVPFPRSDIGHKNALVILEDILINKGNIDDVGPVSSYTFVTTARIPDDDIIKAMYTTNMLNMYCITLPLYSDVNSFNKYLMNIREKIYNFKPISTHKTFKSTYTLTFRNTVEVNEYLSKIKKSTLPYSILHYTYAKKIVTGLTVKIIITSPRETSLKDKHKILGTLGIFSAIDMRMFDEEIKSLEEYNPQYTSPAPFDELSVYHTQDIVRCVNENGIYVPPGLSKGDILKYLQNLQL